MKTVYEDPRLTAYVLGEMTPRERVKFEKEIHDSTELARAVEEMEESASLLGEALPLESADLGLSYAQRESVHRAMQGEKKSDRRWNWLPLSFSPAWGWAGAAMVLCLGGFLWFHTGALDTVRGPAGDAELIPVPVGSENEGKVGQKPAESIRPALDALVVGEKRKFDTHKSAFRADDQAREETGNRDAGSLAGTPPPPPAPNDANVITSNLNSRSVSAPSAAPVATTAPARQSVTGSDSSIASGYEGVSAGLSKQRVDQETTRIAGKPANQPLSYAVTSRDGEIHPGTVDQRYEYRLDNDSIRDRPEIRAEAPGEAYEALRDNPFKRVADVESGTSTFGADVDTASYSNVRRFLQDGQLPPKEAVRIEELLNYFPYDYPKQAEGGAFATSLEIASAPWAPHHRLVRVGIRAQDVAAKERPAMNLVFLVDVSGSMNSDNKLPLVRKALKLLTRNLETRDRVALVVYAGSTGLVLDSTPDKAAILEAIDRLKAGGSTNGEGGIRLAYRVAAANYRENGINRVILCTDGDFNVGVTDRDELVSLIERKRGEGVFLNIYGFGMGNLKDATLEQLADKGNGAYGYIDNFAEARKAFCEQLAGTLITVAKDVKFQIEFNPAQVAAWRQIGYENRQLAREDFNDDTKDAGEVGAGHTVTVLYEIVPAGGEVPVAPDVHRYMEQQAKSEMGNGKPARKELLFLKIRYKEPKEDVSKLQTFAVQDTGRTWQKASEDFKFAASVASFGMLLRESPYAGRANWEQVLALGRAGRGEDEHGHRAEYLRLVETARELSGKD